MTRHFCLFVIVGSIWFGSSAQAAEIQVNSTAEGLGSCAAGSSSCTVRQALLDAKGLPGRDALLVPPGTYAFTGSDLIVSIGEQVDIVGSDPRTTVFQEVAGGDKRVFLVEQDASLRLRGITVTGGSGASGVLLFGGGNELHATDAIFTGNTAARGGAINATGVASVVLDRVTLHGNSATQRGGAIRLADAGSSLTVTRSTITGNTAPIGAAVAVENGSASLTQSTVPEGLDVISPGTIAARASVLGECSAGIVVSGGANVGPGSCQLSGPGDRSGADPALGALGDHGGPTPTRLPAAGSPLLDADASCAAGEVDQRGVARPQGPACDIGAVEVAVAAAPSPTPAVPGSAPLPFPRVTGVTLAATRAKARTVRSRGLKATVRLSAPGVVRLRVERLVRERWRLLPGAVERQLREGATAIRLKRSLPPGRHRLTVRVRAIEPKTVFFPPTIRRFTIVR